MTRLAHVYHFARIYKATGDYRCLQTDSTTRDEAQTSSLWNWTTMEDEKAETLAEGTGEGLAVSLLDVVLVLTFVSVVVLLVYSRLKKKAQQTPRLMRPLSIE